MLDGYEDAKVQMQSCAAALQAFEGKIDGALLGDLQELPLCLLNLYMKD